MTSRKDERRGQERARQPGVPDVSGRFFCLNNAGLWAAGIVIVAEVVFHLWLPGRFFNHEVDELLARMPRQRFEAPVLLLGDSVGRGVFAGFESDPEFTVLACNQAIEMPGQYFLVKRAIRYGWLPGAVVFCGIDPRSGDLEQPLVENYFQRCFTRWPEIGAILRDKQDLVFAAKTAAYKLLPSLKYRLSLQEKLVGATDMDMRGAETAVTAAPESGGGKGHGLFTILKDTLRRRRGERLSIRYLRRLAAELQKQDALFYYLPAPTTPASQDMVTRILAKLDPLEGRFDSFTVLDSLYATYPDAFFSDGTHLNAKGLAVHGPRVTGPLRSIAVEAARRRKGREP